MSKIPGTNVSAKIVPYNTNDNFATHDSLYGQGGLHEVANTSERDAISLKRQRVGMLVYVQDVDTYYQLTTIGEPATYEKLIVDSLAKDVSYTPSTSSAWTPVPDNVKSALDILRTDVDVVSGDLAALDLAASSISIETSGMNITGDDVQTAFVNLEESLLIDIYNLDVTLQTQIDDLSGTVLDLTNVDEGTATGNTLYWDGGTSTWVESSNLTRETGGNYSFSNDVTISGDLIVNGTQFITNTEKVSAADNIIVINAGEIGTGVTSVSAGIEVDRGTLDPYFFIFDDSTDTFRVGEASALQAVATREDNPTNEGIPFWDSTTTKFLTTDKLTWDVADEAIQFSSTTARFTTIKSSDSNSNTLRLFGSTGTELGNIQTIASVQRMLFNVGGASNYVFLTADAAVDTTTISVNAGEMAKFRDTSLELFRSLRLNPTSGKERGIQFQNFAETGYLTMVDATSADGLAVGTDIPSSGDLELRHNGTTQVTLDDTALHIQPTAALQVDNFTGTADAGMFRWTGSEFQGFNGSSWENFGAASIGSGSINLNTSDRLYTVTDGDVTTTTKPVVTLITPTSGDTLFIQAVTNIQNGSFDVVLSDIPSVSGYEVSYLFNVNN